MATGGCPARQRHLAALVLTIVGLWVGGCASMTPERCGGHTAAASPPPASVRCSVRF